jgi:hypothetical protein
MNARRILTLSLLCGVAALATGASSDSSDDWFDIPPVITTAACIKPHVVGSQAQGWRLRGIDNDIVEAGSDVGYQLTLYKGSKYLFLACSDQKDATIKIETRDEQGALVAAGEVVGGAPLMSVSPARTGFYVVRVLMPTGGREKAIFSLATLYR